LLRGEGRVHPRQARGSRRITRLDRRSARLRRRSDRLGRWIRRLDGRHTGQRMVWRHPAAIDTHPVRSRLNGLATRRRLGTNALCRNQTEGHRHCHCQRF
jgi:hypothetical protein